MTFYTITIAPDDPKQATATVRVKITDADVRIDEVVMRAGERGLTARALQAIDLDLLARAVTTPAPGRRTTSAGRPAPVGIPAVEAAPARTSAASATAIVPAEAKAPARATSRRNALVTPAVAVRKVKAENAPTPSTPSSSKPATRPSVKSAKTTTTAELAVGGRTYRRAPDDLADVWRQASTVVAVADHYQVPHHTAASWVRTLKKAAANA